MIHYIIAIIAACIAVGMVGIAVLLWPICRTHRMLGARNRELEQRVEASIRSGTKISAPFARPPTPPPTRYVNDAVAPAARKQ